MGDCYYHGSYDGHGCRYCSGELSEERPYVPISDLITEMNKIEGKRFYDLINYSSLSGEMLFKVVKQICIIAKSDPYFKRASSFEVFLSKENDAWIWYKYGIETTYDNLHNIELFIKKYKLDEEQQMV